MENRGSKIKLMNDKTIEINNKILKFDITIKRILEFDEIIILLIRERKELPNNIIAYNRNGELLWKINDIINAKIPRGFDEMQKINDTTLKSVCELGIIYTIDVLKKEIINVNYLR